MDAVTVSQLNKYIKEKISCDENLKYICMKGEVSNFTNHIKTGHFYFTLKDDACSIRAIMFKGNASKVRFKVENGMNVVVSGSVQVFERDGVYQFYCDTLEPDGIGALHLAFEQLKHKLEKKGLFDAVHKKPLPYLPKSIGIVTSKTGAALQDILNILERRYPIATVVLIPALVQGENAPASIAEGIRAADRSGGIDVLIVGRGGGSIEDLWAFNDELVANAIFECSIPVISAVGHEIDFTIADFVADMRAPTPSAAAELCAPDIAELQRSVLSAQAAIDRSYAMSLKMNYDKLKAMYQRLTAFSPVGRVKQAEADIGIKSERLELAIDNLIHRREQSFKKNVSMLEALSPLKVLTRGYSISFVEDKILSSVDDAVVGQRIETKLKDGVIVSSVEERRHY